MISFKKKHTSNTRKKTCDQKTMMDECRGTVGHIISFFLSKTLG